MSKRVHSCTHKTCSGQRAAARVNQFSKWVLLCLCRTSFFVSISIPTHPSVQPSTQLLIHSTTASPSTYLTNSSFLPSLPPSLQHTLKQRNSESYTPLAHRESASMHTTSNVKCCLQQIMCVHVCVCVCVRACVHVCVCV